MTEATGVKLPVWQTLAGAYGTIWTHKLTLLRLAFVPLGLFVLLSYGVLALRHALPVGFAPEAERSIALLVPLLPFVAYFAACCRLFQLGDPAMGRGWPLSLSPSALRLLDRFWPCPFDRKVLVLLAFFSLYLAARWGLGRTQLWLWVQFSSISTQSGWFHLPLAYALGLLFLYFLLRLSSAPIAAALGQDWSFAAAWRQTAGNGLRLLIVVVLAFLPVELLFAIATWVPFYFVPSPSSELLWLISGLEWLLGVILWVAVTGNASAYLRSSRPASGP